MVGDAPRGAGHDEAFTRRYGPWALLCGASEGLGAAFAEALARRGLNLLLVARREAPLRAQAASLRARFPVEVEHFAADLARPERVIEAVAHREVGLVLHAAAVATVGEFLDVEPSVHAALLDVNIRAPALLAHHFGRTMAARGRGAFLILSSMAATQGTAMVAHYAASKAYQRVLAEGLWTELGPRGVDVICCLAGPTDTPTFRAQRPAGAARFEWPPVMPAPFVAEQTLAALGKSPSVTPGRTQRAAVFLTERLLPRKLAIRLVSRSTRKMYDKG